METQLQYAIRMIYSQLTWRVLYCDEIELLAKHNRVTRNTISKDGLDNFKTKLVSETMSRVFTTEKLAQQLGVKFEEAPEIRNMLDNAIKQTSWKPLGKALESVANWLKAVYNKYGSSPVNESGERQQRVVNRFTVPNRLGWSKDQWEHYMQKADQTFRSMKKETKEGASVASLLGYAKELLASYKKGGQLAYPGLERVIVDLVDTLSQIMNPTINRNQAVILSKYYDTKLYPRLYMLWKFARQSPVR